MDNLKTICVALDFSPASGDALAQAQRLAAFTRAKVHAVHAVFIPVFAPMGPTAMPFELPTSGAAMQDAQAMAAGFFKGRAGAPAPEVDYVIGPPADGILDMAEKRVADLLVLGACSADDAGVGTVAAACVRRASCPVLLVRRGQTGAFKSIAACVDFSETSRLALEQAVRIVARDGGALHVVHMYEEPWSAGLPAGVKQNMPDFSAQYQQGVDARLREFCAPLAHELGALKAQYHAVGHARTWGGGGLGRGLTQFIRTHGVDLTVLGTRSNWNVRDFILGSTAERVVRDARCAILAVKPPGAMGKR